MANNIELFPFGFEWDINKDESNKLKHGISFSSAAKIFLETTLEKDVVHISGEERVVAIGTVKGRFIAVIFTRRGANRRIISARKARINEVKDYEQRYE